MIHIATGVMGTGPVLMCCGMCACTPLSAAWVTISLACYVWWHPQDASICFLLVTNWDRGFCWIDISKFVIYTAIKCVSVVTQPWLDLACCGLNYSLFHTCFLGSSQLLLCWLSCPRHKRISGLLEMCCWDGVLHILIRYTYQHLSSLIIHKNGKA